MLENSEPKLKQNNLLAALSADVQNIVFQHLELVHLPQYALICEPDRPMPYVYFPLTCTITQQYNSEDGHSTGLAVVGNEGLVGINLFLGVDTTPNHSIVQTAGFAYRVSKAKVDEEFKRQGQLMTSVLLYGQYYISQVTQTAVCNRYSSNFERLCRWILLSLDRLEDEKLAMTQEFLSSMLGVRRESVSEACTKLRQQNVITYNRGVIKLIDRPKLECLISECYAEDKKEKNRLLKYLPHKNPIKEFDSNPIAM